MSGEPSQVPAELLWQGPHMQALARGSAPQLQGGELPWGGIFPPGGVVMSFLGRESLAK